MKIVYNNRPIGLRDPKEGESKADWIASQSKASAFKAADKKLRPDAEKVLGAEYDRFTGAGEKAAKPAKTVKLPKTETASEQASA